MTIYTDPAYEADRQHGFDDGLHLGHGRTMHAQESVNAYMTGLEDGIEARAKGIHEKRVAALEKARKAKHLKGEGE